MITNLTPKYYFLDLEVDRVKEMEGEPNPCITQIAILDPSRKNEKNIFNRYVQPPKELSNKPLKNTPKGEQRHLFSEVWPQAVKWINKKLDGNRKAVIVMHNGYKHDWKILSTEVSRVMLITNIAIPNFWKPFDTLWLKNALLVPGEGSLTQICHTMGVPVREAHDAINDVIMTQGIFDKMVGPTPLTQVLVAALDAHPIKKVAEVIKPYNKGLSLLKGNKKVYSKVDTKDAKVVYLVVDYETTGLFQEGKPHPRAVQVAVFMPDEEDASKDMILNELINPDMPIPRGASAVHGIYDPDVQGKENFKAVWLKLNDVIDTKLKSIANAVAVVIGHNYWPYDSQVDKAESERTGLSQKNWKSFDTLFLARNRFKGVEGLPRKGFFKQEYLAPLLGINFTGAHDAANDVMATWGLFKAFTKGVDVSKRDQALFSAHPVVALGGICEDFDGRFYFGLYKEACALTIKFAKELFVGIKNPEFFERDNLAAMLGVNVESNDEELFILWRCFLKLSEGIDRKLVNKALQKEYPLEAIMKLFKESGTFNAEECKLNSITACQLAIPLATALFPDEKEDFYEPKKLAKLVGINGETALSIFESKKMFMTLTAGVPHADIEIACKSEDPAKMLSMKILEKGKFIPADFVEQKNNKESKVTAISTDDFFANSYMDVDNALKRKADTELVKEDSDKKAKTS